MTRINSVLASVLALVVLAVPALASAATPTKNVLLRGTLYKDSLSALEKPIEVKVAATGKTARFTWWCGKQKSLTNRNSVTVAVKPDGSFAGTSNVGSLTVWTVKGRFLTGATARVSLRLISVCDGKGGLVALKGS